MRRYLYLILFAIVLVTPFIMRWAMGVSSRPAAQGERIVIVTPHNADIRREFAHAFDAWHREHYGTGVAVEYRTPGGTNDIRRLLETTYRGFANAKIKPVPDFDLVWGGGDFFFDVELRVPDLQILQPLGIDPKIISDAIPNPTLAGVKLYDQTRDKQGNLLPPMWVGVCLSSFGIVYNPDLYQQLQLPQPQHWHDLTDERLAGMIALADPTHSGSAAVAYMMVLQRAMADAESQYLAQRGPITQPLNEQDPAYKSAISTGWKRGMGELLIIAANARYFTDSASQVPTDISNGEAAAGMAIDFYARVTQEAVGPSRCRFVSPPAATAITPDPIAILYGVEGERLQMAQRFVTFLLTPEAQRLWIVKAGQPGGPRERSLRRPPIRFDIYADRTGWADDVNYYADAGGFNQRAEWMALFGDIRPLWGAAWIDSREALKSAYAKVRAVSDPARRAALIQELADLPIAMSDVEKLREDRRKTPPNEVEQWKAMKRIEWAKNFRAHYAKVAEKAN